MGIKDKLNNFFFLEEVDEEYMDEEVEEPVTEEKRPVKNEHTQSEKINKKPAQNQYKKKAQRQLGEQNVVAMNQSQAIKKPRITVIEPRMYSESQEVADLLLGNQSVILNFRRMEKAQAKKMIDFLMGTTYAIQGDIQRIGEEIFVCTPSTVDIDGAELQAIKNHDF